MSPAVFRGVRLSKLVHCRCAHGLADRWTTAHAALKEERRLWPRPNSPLAEYLNSDDARNEAAEAAMLEASSRERLPPVDEAENFEAYVTHVQSSGIAAAKSAAAEAVALQIKDEATRRRHRLPTAGLFVEEESLPIPPLGANPEFWHPSLGTPDSQYPPQQKLQQHDGEQQKRRVVSDKPLPAGRFSDADRPAPRSAGEALREALANFDLTPRRVKDHLDAHVIAQHDAKRALSVAVCDHFNFARACIRSPELAEAHHVKPNILLLGPSGVGKTHLMRALAKLLGVPFAKGDATKFSATGYVGGDVEDIVRSLVPLAGYAHIYIHCVLLPLLTSNAPARCFKPSW